MRHQSRCSWSGDKGLITSVEVGLRKERVFMAEVLVALKRGFMNLFVDQWALATFLAQNKFSGIARKNSSNSPEKQENHHFSLFSISVQNIIFPKNRWNTLALLEVINWRWVYKQGRKLIIHDFFHFHLARFFWRAWNRQICESFGRPTKMRCQVSWEEKYSKTWVKTFQLNPYG